jgi:ribokinase
VGGSARVVRIAVIGDLLLDVLVEQEGPLEPGDDTPGRISMDSGGQAANVAAWAVALGGAARLVCASATDDSGRLAVARLAARGVEVAGPSLPGPGGVVLSLIAPHGQRTLVSDPGCARQLAPAHLRADWFAGCTWLHVSGYHLFDDGGPEVVLLAAELARDQGAQVSLDLSSAARLRTLGPAAADLRIRQLSPELIFATDDEIAALGGLPPARTCVRKRGADGCVVLTEREQFALPAADVAVVDTTGAGDAFAAGFLLGATPRSAATGAIASAARCIGNLGAMPPLGPPVAPAAP